MRVTFSLATALVWLILLPWGGLDAQIPGGLPGPQAPAVRADSTAGEITRTRLLESGMSPQEIRARLRAAGYPSNLLDQYLTRPQDSLAPPPAPPNQTMREAMSTLGLVELSPRDSLVITQDTLGLRMYEDSLRADSIRVADELAELRRPLTLFGIDVFRQPTTQFQPVVGGPIPDDYRLGIGDRLSLILTGDVERNLPLEVAGDGFIVIPQVGQVFVNNLTVAEFRSLLYERLPQRFSGVSRRSDARTKFEVAVTRVRVSNVRVAGEVNRPGRYPIAATSDVLTALYEAGGLTPRANFRAVQIRRGGELVATVDLYDYLVSGVIGGDVALNSGDVVFVPVRGPRVTIAGEITRPAIYELRPGETLGDLIRIAGGLTPAAALDAATIDRILPPEQRTDPGRTRTVLAVSLFPGEGSEGFSTELLAGDSVTVFAIDGTRRGAVGIAGSVWQPGTYPLTAGMRLSDLLNAAGGIKPQTYLGSAQILRTLPDSTRQLIGVSLEPGSADPALAELDEVTVFARTEFRPVRYVAVYGAVQRPGVISFADSMSLRDAILLAGGLRDDASLADAEISRLRPGVGGGDSLAVVLRVALDSSFVFDPIGYIARPVGADRSPTVLLQPYDNVFVRQHPGWEVQRNVMVTGEVQFPGAYTMLSKDERVSSVLNRAGGLSPQAYPNGIRLFRVEGNAGRIAIDLPAVLANASHRDNIVLASGDSIHIPAFIPTVRVEGAVNSPASVPYSPRRNTTDYVKAAGGFSRSADKGQTFVQQPNGLVETRNARPEPGAVIFVPAKDASDTGFNVTQFLTAVSAFLTPAVAIIALMTR